MRVSRVCARKRLWQSSTDVYRSFSEVAAVPDMRHRSIVAVAVLAAAVLGYVVARLTAPAPEPWASAERKAVKSADTLTLPDSYLDTMSITVETVAAGNLSEEVQAAAVVTPAANGQAIVT